MCGIVEVFNRRAGQLHLNTISQMLALLRRRRPDEFGILLDREAGFGSARLSIIDLHAAVSPSRTRTERSGSSLMARSLTSLNSSMIFLARGPRFRTATDTEVVLHLYESLATLLREAQWQFASLFGSFGDAFFWHATGLASALCFTPETAMALLLRFRSKSLFSDPRVGPRLAPRGVAEVFTFWAAKRRIRCSGTSTSCSRGIRC